MSCEEVRGSTPLGSTIRSYWLFFGMRIEQINLALREGLPFEITTAAGDKFRISRAHQLAFAEGSGVVFIVTDDGLGHIVPLLTVTSITYLKRNGSSRKRHR